MKIDELVRISKVHFIYNGIGRPAEEDKKAVSALADKKLTLENRVHFETVLKKIYNLK